MTKAQVAERDKAREELRGMLKPGDTVYTILRHCSRSGMQRTIDAVTMRNGDGVSSLGPRVAVAIGAKFDRDRWGTKMGGCGMDMGFHLVYNLSYALNPGGFGCIGEGCRSNDHSNGDSDYRPHIDDCPQSPEEVGTDIPRLRSYRHWHSDGGYALSHKWI